MDVISLAASAAANVSTYWSTLRLQITYTYCLRLYYYYYTLTLSLQHEHTWRACSVVNVIKKIWWKFTFPDYWKRLSSAVLTWKKITIFQQILTQELFFVVKIAHSCCTSADWEGNLNFVPTKSFITLTAGLKRFGGESVERLRAPCSRLFSSSFSRKEQKLKNPWNTSEWVRLKFFFVCVDETFIYNRFSS